MTAPSDVADLIRYARQPEPSLPLRPRPRLPLRRLLRDQLPMVPMRHIPEPTPMTDSDQALEYGLVDEIRGITLD